MHFGRSEGVSWADMGGLCAETTTSFVATENIAAVADGMLKFFHALVVVLWDEGFRD